MKAGQVKKAWYREPGSAELIECEILAQNSNVALVSVPGESEPVLVGWGALYDTMEKGRADAIAMLRHSIDAVRRQVERLEDDAGRIERRLYKERQGLLNLKAQLEMVEAVQKIGQRHGS